MNPELFSQAIGFKVADPEVIFDDDPLLPTSSRRFVAAAVDFNFSSQRPGFVIGTAAELPENGWTTHRIEIADLPLPSQFPPEVYWHIDGVNLAADSDLVYVNAIARNGVLNAGNKYEYRNLTVVLSKASLLAGTVVVVAKVYEPELFNASRERTSFSRGAEDSLADRHTYDDTPQYLASMRVAETAQTVVDLGYVDLAAGTIVRLPLTLPVSYLEPAPADQPAAGRRRTTPGGRPQPGRHRPGGHREPRPSLDVPPGDPRGPRPDHRAPARWRKARRPGRTRVHPPQARRNHRRPRRCAAPRPPAPPASRRAQSRSQPPPPRG